MEAGKTLETCPTLDMLMVQSPQDLSQWLLVVRHMVEDRKFISERNDTGWIRFFPNLTVEEVPNYELLLGHSHFAYGEPLSNHTSSTAKLGKRIRPVV